MIKVVVSGALGRMGSEICKAVDADKDMELVGGADPMALEDTTVGSKAVSVYSALDDAIDATSPNVIVDFTRPDAAENNIFCALSRGIDVVLGTTGLSEEKLQSIYEKAHTGNASLFFAPNFTTGAVLMMIFSQQAAKYFPDAEIIELHHDAKLDAPSGTAISTAHKIAAARTLASLAPGKETELCGYEGARGADVDGVAVHSVRTLGHVAHQEVIFGNLGQTLTIRHDSIDRASYMPGILMAIRAVGDMDGLTVGLENLMN